MREPKPFKMRFPHCKGVFPLTQQQVNYNTVFTCPLCHKRNQGSWDAEPDGTLIGRTAQDFHWQEPILRRED